MLSLLDPIKPYLIAGAAVLTIIAGVVVYHAIYQRGYDAAVADDRVKLQKMQDANDRAIAAAEKSLREDLAAMKLQKDKLEDEVAKLDADAAADPAAHTGGISADSVRRLNAVR